MIKLIDILKGVFHDPFTGELSEGLIKTVEVDKAFEIIHKQFSNLPEADIVQDNKNIILGFAPNYLNDDLENYVGTYPDPNISNILTLLNNLGYFPASVEYELNNRAEQYKMKYSPSMFRELISDKQPTYLIFTFEAKYDPVVEVPRYLYHITDSKYLDKIKQIGLKPRALNKRSAHESRIYFSLDKKSSDYLWDKLKLHMGPGKGILLTIDTTNLEVTFYNDPNFDKLGVYTYSNIPPSSIIKYEPIIEN
jgi:hypothetical protein